MNCYATLDDLKAILGITTTARDAELMRALEAASREMEGPSYCNRVFYTRIEARYFDPPIVPSMGAFGDLGKNLFIDDLISASEVLLDTAENGSFATEIEEDTDFVLRPHNGYPKTILEKLDASVVSWPTVPKSVKITGTWGYGDESALPWRAAGRRISISATATSLVLENVADLKAGQTLLVEAEQMFVESVVTAQSVTTATLRRAVNGTVAAAHQTPE